MHRLTPKLLMRAFNRVGDAGAFWARWRPREGEEVIACFFKAAGNRAVRTSHLRSNASRRSLREGQKVSFGTQEDRRRRKAQG
jgi:hypothetical protein